MTLLHTCTWFTQLKKFPLVSLHHTCTWFTQLKQVNIGDFTLYMYLIYPIHVCIYKIKRFLNIIVRKKANIRNRYNQVPHLTQDIMRESDKKHKKHNIQVSQEVSTFPVGDHKAARNRKQITKKDPPMKHRLGTVSKKITGGFYHVWWYKPHHYCWNG